ncbi:MAG: VacJ family lipoprotein [Deltaproteobacteria bacterium]|nr:MAG: VacJ family lipoprotein [Deltaproteobacteria bacterium]
MKVECGTGLSSCLLNRKTKHISVLIIVLLAACIFGAKPATCSHEQFLLIPDSIDLGEAAEEKDLLAIAKAESTRTATEEVDSEWGDESIMPPEPTEEEEFVSDPLEPLNRVFFAFNDKLYFWLLKPVATGYKKVVPERARVGVRNFFSNLMTPIRLFNCLLQGKFRAAGTETLRFIINSTVGFLGVQDVAKQEGNLKIQEEDLGQTLAVFGLGPGIYINWPIFGPSTLRDTIGMVGDAFLDPINYGVTRTKYNIAIKGYDRVNKTSLSLGDYEALKKAALDPYVAIRDAYIQYRRNLIKK